MTMEWAMRVTVLISMCSIRQTKPLMYPLKAK